MGLIVPQTVKVRVSKNMCKYYKEKGYEFEKCGDIIEVDVFDLTKGSHEMVKIICEVCGKETKMCYKEFIKNRKNGISVSCGSKYCRHKKSEDTCTKRYGVKNVMQLEEVKDKIKDTNLERYGFECALLNEEIQNKARDTCMERYGVKHSVQSQEIQNKARKTWQKNYGKYITSPFQLKNVKEKSKRTLQENYGENITNPMQVEEIKNKVLNSFQFNCTGPSSRAQRYINHILNGTLNKCICGSLADIYMEKENIVIEYDGSGHFLKDKINGNIYPTKEALLKEKEREDKIINNGHKMIRFIATKDRIPSDEVILNLIEGFKNSDFKVVRINFEENIIEKDYDEKWYCNFGELRKITQKDLEKFEK